MLLDTLMKGRLITLLIVMKNIVPVKNEHFHSVATTNPNNICGFIVAHSKLIKMHWNCYPRLTNHVN